MNSVNIVKGRATFEAKMPAMLNGSAWLAILIAGMAVAIRCENASKQASGKFSSQVLVKALITNTRSATASANVLKSDPFSFFGQHGVQTASLVFNLDR